MNAVFASLVGALFFSAALDEVPIPEAARRLTPPPTSANQAPAKPANKPPVVDPHAGHDHAKPGAAAVKFPEGPAGTMSLPETVYDAGDVERGTELKHTFVVKNTGKHPLHIEAKAG